MQIQYNMVLDDVLAFHRHHYRTSPAAQRSLMSGLALSSLLVSTFMYQYLRFDGASRRTQLLVAVAMGLITAAIYPWYFRRHSERAVRKMYQEGSNANLLGSRTLSIESTGLREVSLTGDSLIGWSGLSRVSESPEYVFIYTGAVQALVVRRSAVQDGSIDTFLSELRVRVPVEA
jgi:hypothetical protein